VLGFRLALDQGTCRIFAIREGAYIGFCQNEKMTELPDVVLTLVVEDVDGFCALLEKNGAPIEVRPRHNPTYNIYQCFARDPNGYLIEVQRFLDPAWAAQEAIT
jgi:catechol 2,3-dioxygenase-like lactoylglutathione lyase family enzyme